MARDKLVAAERRTSYIVERGWDTVMMLQINGPQMESCCPQKHEWHTRKLRTARTEQRRWNSPAAVPRIDRTLEWYSEQDCYGMDGRGASEKMTGSVTNNRLGLGKD